MNEGYGAATNLRQQEPPAPTPTPRAELQSALEALDGCKRFVSQLEEAVHGPMPEPANKGMGAMPPGPMNLVVLANMVRTEAHVLCERLNKLSDRI